MAILDTDILIGYLRKVPKSRNVIKRIRADETNLKSTVFNVAELYTGAYLSSKTEENLREIVKFLKIIEILKFNREEAEIYSQISVSLRNKGKSIGVFDELIASIAIAHSESIITRNIRHYEKIKNLKVINWEEM